MTCIVCIVTEFVSSYDFSCTMWYDHVFAFFQSHFVNLVIVMHFIFGFPSYFDLLPCKNENEIAKDHLYSSLKNAYALCSLPAINQKHKEKFSNFKNNSKLR